MFVFRNALFTNRNLAIHVLTCKDDLHARLEHSKIRVIVLVDVTRSATNCPKNHPCKKDNKGLKKMPLMENGKQLKCTCQVACKLAS